MRAIMIAATLALLLSATTAAGVGLTPNDRAAEDTCAKNNAAVAFSCFKIGNDETPTVYYLDTGRADGIAGLWEEDNDWAGLQKDQFRYGQSLKPGDLSLLG